MNSELCNLEYVGGQYVVPFLGFEIHCQGAEMEMTQYQLNCGLIWFDNSCVRVLFPGMQECLKLQ